jgi:hypothetical protein
VNEKPNAPPRPAILHTHGGGFITGSALLEIGGLIDLARELDCVIVSVEYSLAPEAIWSVSMEQTYAGLLGFTITPPRWAWTGRGSRWRAKARAEAMPPCSRRPHATEAKCRWPSNA